MNLIGILCAVMLLLPCANEVSTEDVALEKVVESLIGELGSRRYDVRERATQALRRIGSPAQSALAKAAMSDDPEVSVRARAILGDISMGIGPDWPADIVLLVRHYDRLAENERAQALRRMSAALADKAVPFLLLRMSKGSEREAGWALNYLRRINTEEAAQEVVRLLKEPKSTYEKQALAWARSLTGGALEALQILSEGGVDEGTRSKVIEAGLKKTMEQLTDGKFKETAEAAHKFAEAAPGDARFLYLEAEALVALDKDDEAGALRTKALALNPKKEAPHYAVAEMLGELGRRSLSAQEWTRILEIPPAGDVYDINAYLRLGSLYAASGLFEKASTSYQTALDLFRKARAKGHGMGMIGGTEESLTQEIHKLLRKAGQFPAAEGAVIEDALGEKELNINIAISVKDGKADELRKALAGVSATLSMNVQPAGLRLFDVAPMSLRYDPKKQQVLVLLGDSPCGKPVPFKPRDPKPRFALKTVDCCYIFEIDTVSGDVKKIARYEKDYTLTFKPGIKISAWTDVTIRINEKKHEWKTLLKGYEMDSLPEMLDIVMEGTTPTGKRLTSRFKIKLEEPEPAVEKDGDG